MKAHEKKFKSVSLASSNALSQFELTIKKLRSDNEELSILHGNVDEDLEKLKALKENIVNRVTENQAAINGLERVIRGE